ncbi:4a-hydroxytetrahydrobiopterin dehydratase [Sphingobium mellinum]|uniref:4a-hydroxytetrahydrobiopterin dehydratase n=1 Tax=Sphingobium mellinum TaxID=1387166 RepID=UPI0030EC13F5
MIKSLSSEEVAKALAILPGWVYDTDRRALYRAFRFADFAEAIGFMMRVAIEADKADHHPEWSNVYNRVEIWLTTHDAGAVSSRDVALAEKINRFVPG